MAINTENMFMRFFWMERRGVPRSDALRYSLVLSAADTAQPLTGVDLVLTDVVARRQSVQSPPPPPPPPPGDGPLKATFSISIVANDAAKEVLAIQCNDLSGGVVRSYQWDFGDGETSQEQSPRHGYTKTPDGGVLTVKLVISNDEATDEASGVIVFPPTPAPG